MSMPNKELPSRRLNLQEIRKKRCVSLGAIAERTKIASLYLQAIECEQFQILPGCIYSVNYIRQYADAIDYDADLTLAVYREKMKGSDLLLETSPIEVLGACTEPPPSRLVLWLRGAQTEAMRRTTR